MIPSQLIALFSGELPGEESHIAFSPLRGKSSEALEKATHFKESAVAIVIYDLENLQFFVIERQVYEGTHSAQISFPGGKKEGTDTDLFETAVRESYEEIGIQLTKENFICKLTPVFIPVSGFLVQPFVFYISKKPEKLVLSQREVKRLISIKISELLDDKNIIEKDIQVNSTLLKNIKHFTFSTCEIWGATAVMLNEMKTIFKK